MQIADAAYIWWQVDVCHAELLSMKPLLPLSCCRSHLHPSDQARDGCSNLWGGRRTLLNGWDTGPGGGWCTPSLRVGVVLRGTAQHAAPTKQSLESACVSTSVSHHYRTCTTRNCQPSEQHRYNIARFSYSRRRMMLTADHMLLSTDYIYV